MLRGSSFAFRKTVFRTRDRRNFGAAFAISSVIVPYCFGTIAGAIASGRVPPGGEAGDPWSSWVNPTSILGGVLAVVVVAYLAATYLVWDARRLGDDEMATYFRTRAEITAVIAGAVALVGVFVLRADARYLFDGLDLAGPPGRDRLGGVRRRVAAAAAPGSDRQARLAAIGAVAAVMVGWGVAQWPYILPESLEVADAAAPSGTLNALLAATIGAVVIVLPGFILLYVLDQRSLLPEEGAAPSWPIRSSKTSIRCGRTWRARRWVASSAPACPRAMTNASTPIPRLRIAVIRNNVVNETSFCSAPPPNAARPYPIW